MNRDDIINLAHQAGVSVRYGTLGAECWIEDLESFAALVAAAEREACAKLVEQAGIDGMGTLAAAAIIRKRDEK
jgi:hypothetical protein